MLKALEGENGELKKLPAEPILDNAILMDINFESDDARRQTGGRGSCVHGLSQSSRLDLVGLSQAVGPTCPML
jgi:hypothetical protein